MKYQNICMELPRTVHDADSPACIVKGFLLVGEDLFSRFIKHFRFVSKMRGEGRFIGMAGLTGYYGIPCFPYSARQLKTSSIVTQVHMTAVPSAPEKKEMKSLVIPAPVVETREEMEDPWRTIGQKEEPLFRPLQNSQRTTWEVLTRAKNSVQKVGNSFVLTLWQTTICFLMYLVQQD